MGGLKSTLVLLVVLAGLAGYIFFVDAGREPPDDTPPAFTDLSADAIEELEIRDDGDETSRVRKVGDGWELVEPDMAEADSGVVGTVTSNLASLEVQRVVDEAPTDLAQYGLDPARIEVAYRLSGEQAFERLLIGDKTPTGGDVFAKLPGETRVFLISNYLESIFNKKPFDLRDKSVLKFDRDTADGMEIVGGATNLRFTKNGLDWRLTAPFAARADYAGVEGLMTRLSSTYMQAIVSTDADDLAEYGLDAPVLTATVTGGSSRATLLIGRTNDEGLRFAKDVNRPEVFTVEETLLTELSADAATYRRKDLFDGRAFTATRVEIRQGDDTLAFDKRTDDGEETWWNGAGEMVDLMMVEDLLTKLSNVRAQSFDDTPDASLDAPALTVTILFDEDRTETVAFGRTEAAAFAARTDEPGAAVIDATALDEAIEAVEALK